MQSILLVEPSDVLRNALTVELQKHYHVYSCTYGSEGLALICAHQPDGLILNLVTLDIDGVYFLERMEKRPKVIITLATIYPPYVLQKLTDLGVTYPLINFCPVHAIAHHMCSFLELASSSVPPIPQEITAFHLDRLDFPHWGGYDEIRAAVPLFAQDPTQSMVKDLYPAVAVLCDRNSWQQVEKAIRDIKEYAYKHRNDAVWQEYFPGYSRCPTNKEFIARLAKFIR